METTTVSMKMKSFSKQELKKLRALEEDVPCVNFFQTIEEWEMEHGRGFWGNEKTGYIYDKDNK